MNQLLSCLTLGSLLACGTGCRALAATSPRMSEVKHPGPVQPRPDKATVVFSRPSIFGFGLLPVVLDAKGAFLTEVVASSFSTIVLDPGDYTFLACHEHVGALRAKLGSGKVYRVNVSIDFAVNMNDPWGHPRMTPVKAGSTEWQKSLPDRQFVEVPEQSQLFAKNAEVLVRHCLRESAGAVQKRDQELAPSLEESDGQ